MPTAPTPPSPPAKTPVKTPPIAVIAVERALDRELDYRIPAALADKVALGVQVRVPLNKSATNGFIVGFRETSQFMDKLRDIESLVVDKPLIKPALLTLALWMADYYVAPLSLVLKSVLPAPVRKKGERFKEIFVVRRVPDPPKEKLTKKQAATLEHVPEEGEIPLQSLLDLAKTSRTVVNRLEDKGQVSIGRKRVERDPHANDILLASLPPTLMPEQATALAQVIAAVDTNEPQTILLHGVTGAGKTEVYLQAIRHCLDQGKTAIVLVPEISLTPQTVERFRARFGDEVAVLHSALSSGERHDQWHRIHAGKSPIAVGPRSALFAPLENLGLIVVDEEHDTSYKQSETPHYNGRDVAVMRGQMENCTVLLGTATPAIETFQNCLDGKYQIATLTKRVDDRTMPCVRLIDMRIEAEKAGKPHVFSRDLLDAMHARLDRQEQIILFLNRKGYATQLICPSCGFVLECAHCSVALTYYQRTDVLRCNMCGEPASKPPCCPECRMPDFRYAGLGTEKVESYLQDWFKHATIQRVDSESMRTKDSYKRVMHQFRSGQIDMLVGTQMIAKGLDFPNVTLVGVIFADSTLHMPDFRAAERTFQLLTQVAGRAGRGDIAGEVLVQTYTPGHPAVLAAEALDFQRFFDQEIEFRRAHAYPPFAKLSIVTARGKVEHKVAEQMQKFLLAVQGCHPHPKLEIHGPMPAGIVKIKDHYRYQIMFRAPTTKMITRPIRQALQSFRFPSTIRYTIDVDAVSMM